MNYFSEKVEKENEEKENQFLDSIRGSGDRTRTQKAFES